MTAFDYAVLTAVGLSVLLGVWRGAVREAFHLAGWVAAFLVAGAYAGAFSALLPPLLAYPGLRIGAAFAMLFIATLIVAALLGMLVSRLVKGVGLGLADRGLGVVFGLARGLIIVLAAVLLAGLTSLPREPFWREARLSAALVLAAQEVRPWLPPDMARKIRYQ